VQPFSTFFHLHVLVLYKDSAEWFFNITNNISIFLRRQKVHETNFSSPSIKWSTQVTVNLTLWILCSSIMAYSFSTEKKTQLICIAPNLSEHRKHTTTCSLERVNKMDNDLAMVRSVSSTSCHWNSQALMQLFYCQPKRTTLTCLKCQWWTYPRKNARNSTTLLDTLEPMQNNVN